MSLKNTNKIFNYNKYFYW